MPFYACSYYENNVPHMVLVSVQVLRLRAQHRFALVMSGHQHGRLSIKRRCELCCSMWTLQSYHRVWQNPQGMAKWIQGEVRIQGSGFRMTDEYM